MDFSLIPERRLIMTLALRRSLEILQMTQGELAEWLEGAVEKNPLLESSFSRTKLKIEMELPSPISLYEHLQAQIRDNFGAEADRRVAERGLEYLDEKGFIGESADIPENILTLLQTFDPPGIFARNLQEAFLLQLQAAGKREKVAYHLVKECFEDLLKGRFTAIKKDLKVEDLGEAFRDLSLLSFRPAAMYAQEPVKSISPDLKICRIEGGWTVELVEDELPVVNIQSDYLALHPDSTEEIEALREFKTEARWICRTLERRRKMLRAIGRILVTKQAAFLDEKGPLVLLTMKELAEKLEVHESTLSRALSGKYVMTPRGLLPLRSLVTNSPAAETAREVLLKLVRQEDKKKPLTDEELAKELQAKGFSIARRTIAKYRTQLKIGSAAQRKQLCY